LKTTDDSAAQLISMLALDTSDQAVVLITEILSGEELSDTISQAFSRRSNF